MPLTKIAWIATVVVCLACAVITFLAGYNGYAGVILAVGAAAAINIP